MPHAISSFMVISATGLSAVSRSTGNSGCRGCSHSLSAASATFGTMTAGRPSPNGSRGPLVGIHVLVHVHAGRLVSHRDRLLSGHVAGVVGELPGLVVSLHRVPRVPVQEDRQAAAENEDVHVLGEQ